MPNIALKVYSRRGSYLLRSLGVYAYELSCLSNTPVCITAICPQLTNSKGVVVSELTKQIKYPLIVSKETGPLVIRPYKVCFKNNEKVNLIYMQELIKGGTPPHMGGMIGPSKSLVGEEGPEVIVDSLSMFTTVKPITGGGPTLSVLDKNK